MAMLIMTYRGHTLCPKTYSYEANAEHIDAYILRNCGELS